MTALDIYYVKGPPPIQRFVEGVAAATKHLNRAYQARSALECIVLSAVLMDALLRIGIIMKDQLRNDTNAVDERLLQQKDADSKLPERAIIKKAFECGLVNETGRKELSALYDQRNKCIHRYIISDINYDYVTDLVFRYADAVEKVREAVEYVESVQYARGIGLVKAKGDAKESDFDVEVKKWMNELAQAKDKRPNYDA